jgi:hypothetical protein
LHFRGRSWLRIAGINMRGTRGVGPVRRILGLFDEAMLLLLLVFLFPLVILLVGTPVALFVRLLLEIAQRW